ncbi:MAG TPA: rRNA maturation RNase YbeY [Verrucomicrobiae bacterium]|nr:rRNA maturation RNase YbeY [Verrucomicrobiae bacterium]
MLLEVSNEQTIVEIQGSLVQLLEKAANLTIDLTGGDPLGEVSVVLTDDKYIRELNREYRDKDCSTDVLSFSMLESSGEEPKIVGLDEDHVLGDVFISMETAQRQAEEYAHSLEREVVYLAVHGILHLLGYDHMVEADQQRMREREEEVMAKLDLRRETV